MDTNFFDDDGLVTSWFRPPAYVTVRHTERGSRTEWGISVVGGMHQGDTFVLAAMGARTEHLANEQAVDAKPVVGADTLLWGFLHPQAGQLRYTITRTADDDWHEIGERSADGKTNWMKLIEMRLTKAAMAP